MGFDHNPYRHMELLACLPVGIVERRLANIVAGRAPGDERELTTDQLQAAARILAAGYQPPKNARDMPTHWVWYCHNCGGRGGDPHDDLARLVADWVGHLIASHDASPSDFEGWTDL